MEGTRPACSAGWGAGRLCSRVVSVGVSACPNRPRRARERLGRLHTADSRRAVDDTSQCDPERRALAFRMCRPPQGQSAGGMPHWLVFPGFAICFR